MAASSSWRGFWFWYLRQIGDLMPASLRQAANAPLNGLIIEPDPLSDNVRLTRRVRGVETNLPPQPITALPDAVASLPKATKTILRLPPDWLLEREVVLPLAAETDLVGALTLNFDTLTPFSSQEVFWSHTTLRRQASGDLLHVRLSLLPRGRVAALIDMLTASGRAPISAEFVQSGRVIRVMRLAADAGQSAEPWRRMLPVGAGIAAGILLAALLQPTMALLLRQREVEAQIAAVQPQATQAEALRHSLDSSRDGQGLLASERARIGDVLGMLAVLTTALPDDASLSELSISQHRLTLSGEASGAAQLVLALSANPAVSDVAFTAPVTHAASGRKDVFTIAAQSKR